MRILTLPVPFISESRIKLKINLNSYFHTSLWCLKRFYESLFSKYHIIIYFPVYFIKVEERDIPEKEVNDRFNHDVAFKREKFVKGKY